jgi:acyl-CoA dehydrogenase
MDGQEADLLRRLEGRVQMTAQRPYGKTKASWELLPMFFAEEHWALGAQVDRISDDDTALHDPKRVIPRCAELGLTKHLLSPISVRSLCVVREAVAYSSPLADAIYAVEGLGSHPILLANEAEKRRAILDEVIQGTRVCAFALTEPEAGSDVAAMKCVARREGDHFILDGEKVFISNVGIAHHYIVFAKVEGAHADPKKTISAFLVDAHAPGLVLEPIAMSVDHPLGRLAMKGCEIPASALIGDVGMGLRLALGTLDVFRTSVGAAAVGMARRALDEAIGRVQRRVQFGKPLAEQQLTQAALAEMATELDAARLLVARAAWEKDHEDKAHRSDGVSVAMAKMFATEAAQRIIDRAVQLFGGLGVTGNAVVDRLYREIRPLRIYEGTTEIQKLIIGGALIRA